MPAYAWFWKACCTIKNKTNIPQKIFLIEKVSTIVPNKIPIKYKDAGSLTISYVIGDPAFDKALLELRANVNLLPYSIYEELWLDDLKQTRVTPING